MNDQTYCNGSRGEEIVAYLYDDLDAAERERLEAHVQACAACRSEMSSLRGIRRELGRWNPPEPSVGFTPGIAPAPGRIGAWTKMKAVPVWAQAAAAMLLVGAAAGLANIEVRRDEAGFLVRTGWSQPQVVTAPSPSPSAAEVSSPAPWRADLEALAVALRSELQASQAEPRPAAGPQTAEAGVRTLITESERRQQRELALRIAELARDVQAQRRSDLEKIQYSLGIMESNLGAVQNIGVEVMRQRQMINDLAVPVSQGGR
ncbi:MAG: anti-sigma factor [Vicinamibacterales bacterium]